MPSGVFIAPLSPHYYEHTQDALNFMLHVFAINTIQITRSTTKKVLAKDI